MDQLPRLFLFVNLILQIISWSALKYGIVKHNSIHVENTRLLLCILLIIYTLLTLLPLYIISSLLSQYYKLTLWSDLTLNILILQGIVLLIMVYISFTGYYNFSQIFHNQETDETNEIEENDDDEEEKPILKPKNPLDLLPGFYFIKKTNNKKNY